MKRLFLFIFIIAGSVWLGIQIKQDPGYVLLASQHWTIEMPLWFGAMALLLSILLLYGLVKFTIALIALPLTLRSWIKRRRLQKNYRLTQRGLLALAEGRLPQAEKLLLSAKVKETSPLVNYLAAAFAAQGHAANTRANDYLQKALKIAPHADTVVALVQARLHLNASEFAQALAILQGLYQKMPQHVGVLRLLSETYLQLHAWQDLEKLLPILRKRRVLAPAKAYQLEQHVYQGLFSQVLTDVTSVQQIWQHIPRELRKNNSVVAAYVQALINHQAGALAISLLQEQIKAAWSPVLVRLFGLATLKPSEQQLLYAERWLTDYSQDPALLLCLGRICMRKQLWGKARGYLNSCIELSQDPEAYFEFGSLMEQLNDATAAKDYFRQGLAKTINLSV